MRTEEKKSRKSFKGAVLFTILVVMTILIILMITTIGLASAATKRAYSEYNDHQTTSTARSVVDTVIESLRSDNRDFGSDIIDALRANPSSPVIVNVNTDGNLGEGFGIVESLEFRLVGKDSDGAGNFYIQGTGDDIIKVTATVTQGGVTSTYSQYVISDKRSSNNRSSGGGFVAFGGFNGGASDGPTVYAPAYVGIDKPLDYNEEFKFWNTTSVRDLIINSSAKMQESGTAWKLSKGQGVTIMGNFNTGDPLMNVQTDYTPVAADSLSDFPYLFVGGTLRTKKLNMGDGTHPMNVFCGRFVNPATEGAINANVFCYNEDTSQARPTDFSAVDVNKETEAKKSWSLIGGNKSKLVTWAESLTDSSKSHLKTGNVCTLGNLQLTEGFEIGGDIYVDGNLHLENVNNALVGGNIFVKGTVTATGSIDALKNALAASSKKIYCDNLSGLAFDGVSGGFGDGTVSSVVTEFLTGKLSKARLTTDVVTTPESALNSFTEEVNSVQHRKNAVNVSSLNVASARIYYSGNGYGGASEHVMSCAADKTGVNDEQAATSGTVTKTVGGSTQSYDYDVMITDGCTLTGKFYGKNFYFAPSTDIWVNIYNVEMENCKIVVNDENGRVNFYLIDSDNYSGNVDAANNKYEIKNFYRNSNYENTLRSFSKALGSTTSITTEFWDDTGARHTTTKDYKNFFKMMAGNIDVMTLEYYARFKAGQDIDLITYPTASDDFIPGVTPPTVNTDNDWMVPGIAFYSAEDDLVYMSFDNSSTFTGDIYLPNGDFRKGSGASSTAQTSNITWNGDAISRKDIQWIGSLVVNEILKVDNQFILAYVDDPVSGRPGGGSGSHYKWDPIGGYADY